MFRNIWIALSLSVGACTAEQAPGTRPIDMSAQAHLEECKKHLAIAQEQYQRARYMARVRGYITAAHAGDREQEIAKQHGQAATALDPTARLESRRTALQKLVENRPDNLLPLLQTLVTNKVLAAIAVRGLVAYDYPRTPELVISHFQNFTPEQRREIVSALVSRPAYARALLDAVAGGKIGRSDVSAYHARQIRSLGDESPKREKR